MRLKTLSIYGIIVIISAAFVFHTFAQTTISSNKTGKQGDYHYEYWKDNGSGTMTLGDGCDFSCQWGQVGNILFRKGVRPGSRNEVVTYAADYKPQGNSYLSIYGWFKIRLWNITSLKAGAPGNRRAAGQKVILKPTAARMTYTRIRGPVRPSKETKRFNNTGAFAKRNAPAALSPAGTILTHGKRRE